MKPTCLLIVCLLPCLAQRPVAPSEEQVGRARGEDFINYNLVQSYEFGYRFHSVGGNEEKYRSDVNYQNGLRLLSSRFSMNSKDGHGRFFDELTISVLGLGNDPYQSANVRAQKNRLWRYDMLWRSNDYYNPALAISDGQHRIDTTRQWQDHDLTIFPQSRFRFFLGYSRNSQQGPALSTTQLLDLLGDKFPLMADINRKQREFRLGNEFQFLGIKVNWMRTWEKFEESSPLRIEAPQPGSDPSIGATLDHFSRTEPYTGSTPGWRVNVIKTGETYWGLNGRFTYSGGRRGFAFDETASGSDRTGGVYGRQILVGGEARRPVTTGNLTLSIFPAERLTITNHSNFYNTRIDGDASYQEFFNSLQGFTRVDFQFLGVRNFSNTTDASYVFNKRVQAHGGYTYANREFRSVEQQTSGNFVDREEGSQQNSLNAGLAGIRLQPYVGLTLAFDGELGRQDRPFYPTADKNYHGLSARAQYRAKSLTLSAVARSFYNFNSTGLAAHSARNRTYSFDASWQAPRWVALDAGYSKLHSDTASWLSYFVSFNETPGRSLWVSNIHAGHLAATIVAGPRVIVTLGYSRTQDTGGHLPGPPPSPEVFIGAQQFPMFFESPFGRLSFKLLEKLRWNFGYQHYRYGEDTLPVLGYRAHTGFTSLLWTF